MQQTPDLLEKLAESLLYNFIVNTFFSKIEDKNVIAEKNSCFFFISYNNLFSGLRD